MKGSLNEITDKKTSENVNNKHNLTELPGY